MVRTQTDTLWRVPISSIFDDRATSRVSSADITYASLAKAFDQPLVHHAETLRRMAELIKHGSWVHTQNEEQKRARERMALFPANAELFFVARDIWVVSNHLSVLSPMYFFLIRSTGLASCAARREALRTSGNTELVPEDARRIKGTLTATSPFATALPTSDLHPVSVQYTCILACILLTIVASHHTRCIVFRNPQLRRTSRNCRNA
jgi:hypothetical protein